MSPAEVIRRAVRDQAVQLIEGRHDGIGEAAIDALYAEGWRVVRIEGRFAYEITEEARP